MKTFTVTGPHAVHAEFRQVMHRLDVKVNGSGAAGPSGEFPEGSVQTVTFSPAQGYEVTEVLLDGVAQTVSESIDVSMTGDRTVEVTFSEVRFTLTVVVDGQGSVSPGAGTYAYGTMLTLSFNPSKGHRVSEVFLDGAPKGKVDTLDVTMLADHTVRVVFETIPVQTMRTLSVEIEGNGSVTPVGGSSFIDGTGITVTVTPDEGWYIHEVFLDGESKGTASGFGLVMDSDHTVKVVFKRSTYDLTISSTMGGTYSPLSGTYQHDITVTVTATPYTGWEVSSFIVDGIDKGPLTQYTLTMDSDHMVEIVFSERSFTLKVTSGDGGRTDPAGESVHSYGDEVIVTFLPSKGFEVGYVLLDSVRVEVQADVLKVLMTSDHTVHVEFASMADLGIEVVREPDVLEYDEGDELDVTGMVVRLNHADGTHTVITDYTVSPTVLDTPGEVVVTVTYGGFTDTFTVTVHETHVIEATVQGEGTISPSGTIVVRDGSDLDFVAEPEDGWSFLKFIVNGSDNTHTRGSFRMSNISADGSIVAVFISGVVDRIVIEKNPDKTVYREGEEFDPTGMQVRVYYTDGRNGLLSQNEYSWSPKRLNDPGDQDVTVTYGGRSAAVQVSVQPHPITEFAVFVTGHNGVPVDGEERLRDFTFDTSAMAPGDVRTLGLKITGRVTGGLTSALILDSFASTQVAVGDVPDLARHVAITISCEGEELTSTTLDRLWDGHVLDLGPVPEDGLDVELSIGLLHTGDTMRQSLSFGLAVWGYSEADI
ncbi:MAG: bacterial Ig-like domain-containing protein [Candidatus Methanomethylophilaceae archaeon]|nr:bacterial Ig-like domain-containing protein [Candidatus Methanomethylophilaceae archaeon]